MKRKLNKILGEGNWRYNEKLQTIRYMYWKPLTKELQQQLGIKTTPIEVENDECGLLVTNKIL